MNILKKIFSSKDASSAAQAKERLQIVISHQRYNAKISHLLPKMQQDLIKVINKYVPDIAEDKININLQQREDKAMLELNVAIPQD